MAPGFPVVAVILLLMLYLDYRRDKLMSAGLTGLAAAVADLSAKVSAVDADVKKLLANSTAGPGPGQVIVNQADIDALTASVSAASGTLAADDAAVNPPAPAV